MKRFTSWCCERGLVAAMVLATVFTLAGGIWQDAHAQASEIMATRPLKSWRYVGNGTATGVLTPFDTLTFVGAAAGATKDSLGTQGYIDTLYAYIPDFAGSRNLLGISGAAGASIRLTVASQSGQTFAGIDTMFAIAEGSPDNINFQQNVSWINGLVPTGTRPNSQVSFLVLPNTTAANPNYELWPYFRFRVRVDGNTAALWPAARVWITYSSTGQTGQITAPPGF